MKLFFGEFKPDYKKYHFPYQVWLLKEESDDVGKIYTNGFLPIRSYPNIFYLSRSLRVNLSQFEPSSENRRILKKTEGVSVQVVPLSNFSYTPRIQKLCADYAGQRFGRGIMPAPTIKAIFTGTVYTHVIVYKNSENQDIGYAVCFVNDSLLQYAHSFYDLACLEKNLGARMMLEAVTWAKENGKQYAYLGTCYETKALYKTEFKGVEFFNGFTWSSNLEELKSLITRDSDQYLLRDKDYLNNFHGDLHALLSKYGTRVIF